MKDFIEASAYAKCILAGEHSVLRGYPAIVFPVKGCQLKTKFKETGDSLKVHFEGDYSDSLSVVFWGVLEKSCEKLGLQRTDLTGEWYLQNEIPIGGGLGASAALCVSMARFFQLQGHIKENSIYEFARSLENLFHGESSGVDIAASMSDGPIRFLRGGDRTPVKLKWEPKMYLSYCGEKGVTSDCVERVKQNLMKHPELGRKIDKEMGEAVEAAERSFGVDKKLGMQSLAVSIEQGKNCFEQWGLISDQLQSHISKVMEMGAVAAKPTGSGRGGYVLSLWDEEPQNFEEIQWIPVL